MYFAYVDESGDPGRFDDTRRNHSTGTRHYCLCGILIPSDCWTEYLAGMVGVRRELRRNFNFPVRKELHAAELIHPRSNRTTLLLGGRRRRVELYRFALRGFAKIMPRARLIAVNVDKKMIADPLPQGLDYEQMAWDAFLRRYQRILDASKGAAASHGLIFADETNEVKIRAQLRRMRRQSVSPALFPDRPSEGQMRILEDPVMRNSAQSYFVQFADLAAHALYRHRYPAGGLRKYNVDLLFNELSPLLQGEHGGSEEEGIIDLQT